MLKLNLTTQFKRDLKQCKKRNYNISLLNAIVNTLRIPAALPPKNNHGSSLCPSYCWKGFFYALLPFIGYNCRYLNYRSGTREYLLLSMGVQSVTYFLTGYNL